VSGTILAYNANEQTLVEIPRTGGTYTEGIVGTPRFINPVLAYSDADRDLSSVIYAGLVTRDHDGTLVPELAESYTISEDKTTYTFTLRDGLTFHDGSTLTADDVVFTVDQAANPVIRSPLLANWDGVQVTALDPRTVEFKLPAPYSPFLENTRLGILPKHIWESLSPEEFRDSQLNTRPVGAGPYKIQNVARDKSGILTSFELTRFDKYVRGAPHIPTFVFRLYKNHDEAERAFARGVITAVQGVTPTHADEILTSDKLGKTVVLRAPLLRTFGIFFNHNKQPLFLRDEVRKALDVATPKQAVVGEILHGYGTVLNGPLPLYLLPTADESATTTTAHDDPSVETSGDSTPTKRIEQARSILEKAGWERESATSTYILKKKDSTTRLSITLSTVNNPEVMQAAERIAKSWREVGVSVEVKVFDPADILQSVIRPRRYEALLFGESIGHEVDLYAFWHSSQRNDPGLNIAQYADIEADALLEKIRAEDDPTARATLYKTFVKQIETQHEAIFIYAPDLIYLTRNTVKDIVLHPIDESSDRFDNVHEWYVETDHVWPFIERWLN